MFLSDQKGANDISYHEIYSVREKHVGLEPKHLPSACRLRPLSCSSEEVRVEGRAGLLSPETDFLRCTVY